MLILMKQKIL